MIQTTVGKLVEMIPGATAEASWAAVEVFGASKDTREIITGSVYIPLIGEQFDGHDFVQEAIDKGASCSLWQRDHGEAPSGIPIVWVDDSLIALQQLASAYRRQLKVKVIGITGSNGKTTTKDMVSSVLASTYRVHKTKGNLNNHIGLPMTILELSAETEFAVLEMGMSGFGEIELLSRIAQPDCAIINNIGEAHMLQLGSREGIARAKFEITVGLADGGTLIYNGDEPLLAQLLADEDKKRPFRTIRFGISTTNDYYPEISNISIDGSEFTAIRQQAGSQVKQLSIPMLGRHNVVNAMSSVAVADLFGVQEAGLRSGLSDMTPTGMRIEVVKATNGATLLNDAYNANPSSVYAALHLLDELSCSGRKIVVLGDLLELGPNAAHFHREIGNALHPDKVQSVFTYGEMSAYIAEGCRSRYREGAVQWFEDKQLLIQKLSNFIEPQDIVLVKASKGTNLVEVVHALTLT